MDTHALSLKVMRLSRPSLAVSSQPLFLNSTALSAHATASILSLQGPTPLPSHPNTLRDFSLSEVLTLPASFGSIQLGETFTSSICVNNDSYHPPIDINGIAVKVEMQTAATKIMIAEAGSANTTLRASEFLESVVSHEIKELGQHVLACTVSYHIPPSLAHSYGAPEDPSNPTLRVLKKYYKFMVTNPLSVKTKVQTSKSSNTTLTSSERQKVFLEVHIQNLTQQPLCFDRLKFECVEGWQFFDGNATNSDLDRKKENLFSAAMAMMQPQDLRQYLYVLTPTLTNLFTAPEQPGQVIQLGRLDISWRTSFGEPGRLLTSVLSRRIPLQPVNSQASALPPHLQRATQPARPQSPQPPSRPSSPSPFKIRAPRPQSPALPQQITTLIRPDFDIFLNIRSLPPRGQVLAQKPFKVAFNLGLSTCIVPDPARSIKLFVQYLSPKREHQGGAPRHPTMPSGSNLTPTSPSPFGTPRRGHFNFNWDTEGPPEIKQDERAKKYLPAPFSNSVALEGEGIVPLGPTAVILSPKWITSGPSRWEAVCDVGQEFLPLRTGIVGLGGMRVILMGGDEEEPVVVLGEWEEIGQVVVGNVIG